MTREEGEAFLKWFSEATAAQQVVASAEIVEDPAARDARNKVMEEVLAIFSPVADIVDTIFHAAPGEGLAMKADKNGNVLEVMRARQPGKIALA
jgi:hypothetical protein